MASRETTPLTLDDVYRLSSGMRTSKRIGSRSIQHRLNKHERTQFENARTLGLFWSITSVNPAALNTYYNFCLSTGRPFITLLRERELFCLTISFDTRLQGSVDKFKEYNDKIERFLESNLPTLKNSHLEGITIAMSVDEAKCFLAKFRSEIL